MAGINDSLYTLAKFTNTEAVKRKLENTESREQINRLAYINYRNKIFFFSLTGALLSLGIILYLWGINLKRRNKITQQNQVLEEQRVLALLQHRELEAVNATMKAREKERQKIAEELHDNLGSSLATIKLHIENLLVNGKQNNQLQKEVLNKMESVIDDTYRKIRNISHLKSSTIVEQQGLLLALNRLAEQINTGNHTKVSIDITGFDTLARNDLKIFIYNGIQELLTNAMKHAKATEINIQITQHDTELNILFSDNGIGFKADHLHFKKGIGLYQIRKKTEALFGRFYIDSTPGKGTTVNITLPI